MCRGSCAQLPELRYPIPTINHQTSTKRDAHARGGLVAHVFSRTPARRRSPLLACSRSRRQKLFRFLDRTYGTAVSVGKLQSCSLTQLQTLGLYSNPSLSGTITTKMGSLTQLQELYLVL